MKKDVVLVNTVEDKKSSYTQRDYLNAVQARRLQNIIGRPSLKTYLHMIDNCLLPNCPVTRQDVLAAEDIFGPNLGILKGKTTRRKGGRVQMETIPLPIEIKERYQTVTLCADIMF